MFNYKNRCQYEKKKNILSVAYVVNGAPQKKNNLKQFSLSYKT